MPKLRGQSKRWLIAISQPSTPSDGPAAANEAEHDDHHRDHQQEMDQSA
jgi:hypothetical protein